MTGVRGIVVWGLTAPVMSLVLFFTLHRPLRAMARQLKPKLLRSRCFYSCPLMMLYFLFKVTGIPLTEEHAVLGKGEPYRDYQRRVSAFIPWFPKKSP